MKILIPLDGLKFAEAALPQAAKLVRETAAEPDLGAVVGGGREHPFIARSPR